jgi:hypothetical protein
VPDPASSRAFAYQALFFYALLAMLGAWSVGELTSTKGSLMVNNIQIMEVWSSGRRLRAFDRFDEFSVSGRKAIFGCAPQGFVASSVCWAK